MKKLIVLCVFFVACYPVFSQSGVDITKLRPGTRMELRIEGKEGEISVDSTGLNDCVITVYPADTSNEEIVMQVMLLGGMYNLRLIDLEKDKERFLQYGYNIGVWQGHYNKKYGRNFDLLKDLRFSTIIAWRRQPVIPGLPEDIVLIAFFLVEDEELNGFAFFAK